MLLNLKAFRVSKGYTQEEFGKLFGIGKITYFKLESGQTEIKKKYMDRILELYPDENIDIMELFKDIELKRG
jgi:transcriptional regulator with XRE-family HTH domain